MCFSIHENSVVLLELNEAEKEHDSVCVNDVRLREGGSRWINRARRSFPIRPSSDDVVKPLSTNGQLPFRFAILWRSLQENLLRVTLTPVA
ncbi:hypothetical protein DPMN_110958 [Dreissena polymorpha]|uniref:Uncharacterized protein n=1 Tax=Dreissena polymorpha TaxID=45954 RepID=A0A9D4KDK3_DREPO|nr:hypothetical protein DPMN_110958 [Dreissena polymorpha]